MNMKILQRQLLLKQTLFGISWLAVGALLPYIQHDAPSFCLQMWLFMLLAFVSCRFAGMSFNRFIDRHIDAKNVRTQDRPLPKGEISERACLAQAIAFLGLFMTSAWAINSLCGLLSFGISGLVIAYSYTKRFTALCHFVLASIHFFAPVCAWAAVTGSMSMAPVLLGAALFFSIAAADIIYACQDMEFDRQQGLYSLPASLGAPRSCLVSRLLHIASVISLWLLCKTLGSPLLFLATSLVACLYASCHVKLARDEMDHQATFSLVNTVSGLILFVFTLGELYWHFA